MFGKQITMWLGICIDCIDPGSKPQKKEWFLLDDDKPLLKTGGW